jgi:hypothetical protein
MLRGDDLAMFTLTMGAIKPVRKRRNDFVHGLWGVADEIANGLLLAAADDRVTLDTILNGAVPKDQSAMNALAHAFDLQGANKGLSRTGPLIRLATRR